MRSIGILLNIEVAEAKPSTSIRLKIIVVIIAIDGSVGLFGFILNEDSWHSSPAQFVSVAVKEPSQPASPPVYCRHLESIHYDIFKLRLSLMKMYDTNV